MRYGQKSRFRCWRFKGGNQGEGEKAHLHQYVEALARCAKRPPSAVHCVAMASTEAASTVFVGSISPGVSDRWLVQLFQACGGYRSFKRVSKAFGFADFSTLRDALRVLAVLHGLELPSMGASRGEPTKKLIVKADEKTSAFLGEFEKTMVRTDADALQDAAARARVDYVVSAMAKPNAETGDEPERYEIPSHLKDLSMAEIPASRRKHVLSEIEKFRLGAVASDAADRRRELELERQRAAMLARQSPSVSSPAPSTPLQGDDDPEAADEAAEKDRVRREEARRANEARHVEHEYMQREQARLAAWEQATPMTRPSIDAWAAMDEDTELTRELFWTDRRRWAHQRGEARKREEAADAADRDAEAAEQSDAQQQADAFLAELAPMAQPAWRPGAPLKLQVWHGDVPPGVQRRLDLEDKLRAHPANRVELVEALSRHDLYQVTPAWTRIDVASAASVVDEGIAESFGERVPDLVEAALDKLREHASAQDVVDVLAPVLDEEASDVVDKLWRFLLLVP